MTQAERIYGIKDIAEASEAAISTAVAEDQLWASETTVFIFDDNSRIAFSGPERWLIDTRKDEMLIELMEAKEQGVCEVWYGQVEQAEPVDIDEAIKDIEQMDPDVMGDGTWGY